MSIYTEQKKLASISNLSDATRIEYFQTSVPVISASCTYQGLASIPLLLAATLLLINCNIWLYRFRSAQKQKLNGGRKKKQHILQVSIINHTSARADPPSDL